MISAGLNLTHALDRRFGLAPKKTLSQRDVPGMTRAALPLLAKAGVPFISIGTNNGPYKPVSLPNAFLWRDNATGAEALVSWHSFGYGTVSAPSSATDKTGAWEDCQDGQDGCEDGLAEPSYLQIPGYNETLVLNWRSDNQVWPAIPFFEVVNIMQYIWRRMILI